MRLRVVQLGILPSNLSPNLRVYPFVIFVLTFVYLNLPCDSTGKKLFVVLLTLYKSAEYISEIP